MKQNLTPEQLNELARQFLAEKRDAPQEDCFDMLVARVMEGQVLLDPFRIGWFKDTVFNRNESESAQFLLALFEAVQQRLTHA